MEVSEQETCLALYLLYLVCLMHLQCNSRESYARDWDVAAGTLWGAHHRHDDDGRRKVSAAAADDMAAVGAVLKAGNWDIPITGCW